MKNYGILFFVKNINYRIPRKKETRIWIFKSICQENKTLGIINIILCDDNYLLSLNQQYLSHDTLTDIITFDLSENNILSGDIFISIGRIKENAKKYGVKVNDELHRVIIHGVLHLCGYKDKSNQEKLNMRQKEDQYLSIRSEKLYMIT